MTTKAQPENNWQCTLFNEDVWNVTLNGQIKGRIVHKNPRFSAFLKQNEYSTGAFIGQYDTVPEAVEAIKVMEDLK